MNNAIIINTCDWGSTGKIAKGLCSFLLGKKVNSYFFYGRGNQSDIQNHSVKMELYIEVLAHYLLSKLIGSDGYGSVFATGRLLREIKKLAIDTVYILSLRGHYINENKFFNYLAKEKLKVIYIMIDEYPYLGSCAYGNECAGYEQKCIRCKRIRNPISRILNLSHKRFESKYYYYRHLSKPVFVGPRFTIERSKSSGLLDGLAVIELDEAVDTVFFKPRNTESIRRELKIKDSDIAMVCIAPYSNERKGVRFFYELAKRFEKDDRFVFIHVGCDVDNVDVSSNMRIIGYVSDQEKLAQYYSLADLFVFPSLSDTMPNTCLEALSCGSPLLCFNTSGMPYIADDSVASLVEVGNIEEMCSVVENTDKKDASIVEKCRGYALSRYDRNKYYQMLLDIGLSDV